ncbi:unnamed protein product, partial [Onchocerca flexuosa]|uniref:SH2 domain-containing protein n=1 Tax=Onchocerca flexuosa TaxID=387005 RepID=A0A183HGZ4_9BILA
DIWHQSTEIPEVSCTVHIVLTARPSSRRKQSVHAIVINTPKNTEKSEKPHSLPPEFNNNNRSSNLQNYANVKNASSGNESSRLWRFLSRKKYSSFKKYLKLHQKNTPTTEITSEIKVLGFSKRNSSVIMNGKNHLPQCNSGSKWKIKEIESDRGLPLSRTNLSLVLDIKPDQRFSQMPNSVHEQLSGYEVANDVKWRSNIDSANSRTSNGRIGSNRTCFSMESIDLVKENGIDDRLKFLGETKRIQPVDEPSSALSVWKRKVSCVVFLVFNLR